MKLPLFLGLIASASTVMANLPPNLVHSVTVERSPNNPLITFNSSPTLGENINGPSVIKAPAWLENPLGAYYMYFAHHGGKYIRLAYADDLHGPWKIHEPGVLKLEQVEQFYGHIASPDVHVDDEQQVIRMYVHGPIREAPQSTMVATSLDGLNFEPGDEVLGLSYFRVFERGDYYYAIDGSGFLNRSKQFDREWERREEMLVAPAIVTDEHGRRGNVRIRHSAVLVEDEVLYLFYTRKEDAPERILLATVSLSEDWTDWVASEPIEVMRPEAAYEGVEHPVTPSASGYADHVRQLRDPAIFEEDGRYYLFYSIAGEMGIAMAEIKMKKAPSITADGESLSVVVRANEQAAPVRLKVAPPEIRASKQEKIVPGDYDPSFEKWDIWHKLFKGKPGSVPVTPEYDEDGVHILGGLFQSVLPESVVVSSLDGEVFRLNEDYRYEPVLAKIAAIDGNLGEPGKDKVQVSCKYATQRLDLVQAGPDGAVSIKQGDPVMVCPQLPKPDPGALALAGVYIAPWKRDGSFVVTQEDVFPINPAPPVIPHNSQFVERSVEILEKGGELKIAFVGDSVTLGAEAGAWWENLWTRENTSYVSRLIVGLREQYPNATVTPIHAAQGGSTTKAAANLFDDTIAPAKADVVLIAFGLNDAYSSIGGKPNNPPLQYKEDVRAIVTRAKAIGAEVILVSPMQPNPWLKCGLAPRIVEYRDILRELADEEQVGFADIHSEWMRQATLGIPPFSQLHNWINHPGPAGHAVYSGMLTRFFQRS